MTDFYWNTEVLKYITRFSQFRDSFIEVTGIHDMEVIHYHFETFLQGYCDCDDCVANGDGLFITFKHSPHDDNDADFDGDDYNE